MKNIPVREIGGDKDPRKCDIRGAGNSFHVEYVLEVADAWETANITHFEGGRSADDLNENEMEAGWVVEPDDSPGFAMLQLFESDGDDGDQKILHRLSIDTCFQLADMFKLIAERIKEEQLDAEAEELAEQVETARMHPPLPFDGE